MPASSAGYATLALRTSLALAVLLAGCTTLEPKYEVPAVDTPVAFKEGSGAWVPAAPADTLERGPWWELFDDRVLSALAAQVDVGNQNVAAAVAAYAQARAITREQRAALFPQVGLDAARSVTGGPERPTTRSYRVEIGASWEPDVFGRLRLGVRSARAGEQVLLADLAAARLAAQGELAVAYFGLREADVQRALLAETIAGYERTLRIVRNRYEAGIVARTDVLQAQTQLANAQADLLALDRQRAQLEHAVAVLVGRPPAALRIEPVASWSPRLPPVPPALPSTLLLRRPDIVAAGQRVAQANEQIGIARSAYFPSLRLSGTAGLGAASVGELFSAGNLVWSLGLSLAQAVFDAGGTAARVERAGAGYEQAVTGYRQAVLEAFQSVEDQLAATRILGEQLALRELAADAAGRAERQVFNRYEAGQVGFSEVINAQATAQNARRSLVQLRRDRLVAAVGLIQAIGGDW